MINLTFILFIYFSVHHGTLEKEEEFIEQCMESLMNASSKTEEVINFNHLSVFIVRHAIAFIL